VKKCDVECLSLKSFIKKTFKTRKGRTTEVNPFSIPWTRKRFFFILNGVLENVLVCAQFSSKLAHGT